MDRNFGADVDVLKALLTDYTDNSLCKTKVKVELVDRFLESGLHRNIHHKDTDYNTARWTSDVAWEWESCGSQDETFSEFGDFHDCSQPSNMVSTDSANIDEELCDLTNILSFDISKYIQDIDIPLVEPEGQNMEVNSAGSCGILPSKLVAPGPKVMLGMLKPPYNYTELIQLALQEKDRLTVDGIYKWIQTTFPYFRNTDSKKWKNGIRHKLTTSLNFKKVGKETGRGHLWGLISDASRISHPMVQKKNHWKKQKIAEYQNQKVVIPGTRKKIILKANSPEDKNKENKHPQLHDVQKLSFTQNSTRGYSCSTPSISDYTSEGVSKLDDQGVNTVVPTASRLPTTSSHLACISANKAVSGSSATQIENPCLPIPRGMFIVSNAAFLNPLSPSEVVMESGLLDDPPSTQTIQSIPNASFMAANIEGSGEQDLFADLFKYQQNASQIILTP